MPFVNTMTKMQMIYINMITQVGRRKLAKTTTMIRRLGAKHNFVKEETISFGYD